MGEVDVAALILRGMLGVVLLAHGWNHLFGPGGVEGRTGLGLSALLGLGSAAALLGACWRPAAAAAALDADL